MPNLQSQIGILYRVIGQSHPESDRDELHISHLRGQERLRRLDCSAGSASGNRPGGWIRSLYCLWFSLPLSVWLSTGSIGLFLYWQVLSSVACLVEKLTIKRKLAFGALDCHEGDASCTAIAIEAR